MVPYSRVLTKVKPVTSTAIPSPVPELSFLPEPGRAKRESRITNQWKITRPLSIRVHTCSRQSVAQYLSQLARWKKKHFLWCWYCGKKQIDMCFIVVCTLIDNDYASIIFSQTFFRVLSAFWASLQKGFERKVWRVQVAHLQKVARALSSLSRCFQLSTNLDRDFFRYLWYCGKNKSNVV